MSATVTSEARRDKPDQTRYARGNHGNSNTSSAQSGHGFARLSQGFGR